MAWGMKSSTKITMLGRGLFNCFGRCPNHGHFLKEFIFQNALKISCGRPWGLLGLLGGGGGSLCSLHGTQNYNFRCGCELFSVFRSVPWHSKFEFSLRSPSVYCDSSVWLPFKIRILAWISLCFLRFKRLAGLQN